MEWHNAIEDVRPFIFRVITPYGSGTGFIVSHSESGDLFGVATAAHVIAKAHEWELPIRLEHDASGEALVLHRKERAIFIDDSCDSAAILFQPNKLKLPSNPPALIAADKIIKEGVEIGWLGFPALSPQNLCFFHGRVSAHIDNESGYLVDGVAINGVSGGPALSLGEPRYIGVVSAYIPNRATGEALPGLAVVRDVTQFHNIINRIHDIDEARKKQTKPSDVRPPEDEASKEHIKPSDAHLPEPDGKPTRNSK